MASTEQVMEVFNTGANRNVSNDKFDYEGFLSPAVLDRYAAYMHRNRSLPDGSVRDSDNWQLGIPLANYMKSLFRHFMDVWRYHRGLATEDDIENSLCAVLFNASGYLHEVLKQRNADRA